MASMMIKDVLDVIPALQLGDIVVTNDGTRYIFYPTWHDSSWTKYIYDIYDDDGLRNGFFLEPKHQGYLFVSQYNRDLTLKDGDEYDKVEFDIKEVWRPQCIYSLADIDFIIPGNKTPQEGWDLIWKRETVIDFDSDEFVDTMQEFLNKMIEHPEEEKALFKLMCKKAFNAETVEDVDITARTVTL